MFRSCVRPIGYRSEVLQFAAPPQLPALIFVKFLIFRTAIDALFISEWAILFFFFAGRKPHHHQAEHDGDRNSSKTGHILLPRRDTRGRLANAATIVGFNCKSTNSSDTRRIQQSPSPIHNIEHVKPDNPDSIQPKRGGLTAAPIADSLILSASGLLVVGSAPTPSARSEATGNDTFPIDRRHDITVTGEKCLGRAHFRTKRKLAFGETIPTVLRELLGGIIRLGATGTEGTFVHLATRSEIARLRILRRTEGARIETITTTDAKVLRVKHHAIVVLVETIHWAYRHARRIGAVHAGDRNRAFARFTILDRHDAPAVYTPRNLVFVFAGCDASVALNATFGVTQKFHPCHALFLPYARSILQSVALLSCIWVTES